MDDVTISRHSRWKESFDDDDIDDGKPPRMPTHANISPGMADFSRGLMLMHGMPDAAACREPYTSRNEAHGRRDGWHRVPARPNSLFASFFELATMRAVTHFRPLSLARRMPSPQEISRCAYLPSYFPLISPSPAPIRFCTES